MKRKYNTLTKEQLALAQKQRQEYRLTIGENFQDLLGSQDAQDSLSFKLRFKRIIKKSLLFCLNILNQREMTGTQYLALSKLRLKTVRAYFTKRYSGRKNVKLNDWENPAVRHGSAGIFDGPRRQPFLPQLKRSVAFLLLCRRRLP